MMGTLAGEGEHGFFIALMELVQTSVAAKENGRKAVTRISNKKSLALGYCLVPASGRWSLQWCNGYSKLRRGVIVRGGRDVRGFSGWCSLNCVATKIALKRASGWQ